jgi:hypothetical protein
LGKEQESKSNNQINLLLRRKKATKAKSQVAMKISKIVQLVRIWGKELLEVSLLS